MTIIDKIRQNPQLKHFVVGLISSHKNPRPRLWVRLFLTPFVHKRGCGAKVRRRARLDIFPWHRFELGRDALIEEYATINNGAGDVVIRDGAHVGIGCVVIGPVTIGERVSMAQHILVAGFNHGYEDVTTDPDTQPLDKREVTIDEEVFIGANSCILAGVHIGRHAQIGAGSVVTRDVPPFSVAVGNPARVIRRYDFERKEWVKVNNE